MALNDEGAEQRMREEITNAFKQAVDNTPKASLVAIPQEIKARLAILADLASRLRSPVSRNPYDKTVNYQPDIEGPARLVKAFGKLGKGLSAVRGKLEMTDQEYEVIKTVATDTAPKGRMEIVRYLLNRQWHRTKDIASYLDMPQTTATRELEDLMMIKVLERRPDLEGGKELGQTTPYRWQLRGEIANLITKAGLFEADD
jgi:hypothetical protein